MSDWSIKQLAAKFGYTEQHVRKLCARGKLPLGFTAQKTNRGWRIIEALAGEAPDPFVVSEEFQRKLALEGLKTLPVSTLLTLEGLLGHVEVLDEHSSVMRAEPGSNKVKTITFDIYENRSIVVRNTNRGVHYNFANLVDMFAFVWRLCVAQRKWHGELDVRKVIHDQLETAIFQTNPNRKLFESLCVAGCGSARKSSRTLFCDSSFCGSRIFWEWCDSLSRKPSDVIDKAIEDKRETFRSTHIANL